MNKKSVFFTYTAVLMISVMVLLFTSETYVSLKGKIPVTKHRIQLANDHINNIHNIYLKRATYATGYRGLYALVFEINQTKKFFDNKKTFEGNFSLAFLNGTIRGRKSSVMNGTAMIDILRMLENLSWDAYHINTTFEKNLNKINVTVFQTNQTGPWSVGINMTINYSVDADLARWNRQDLIEVFFNLEGLYDPLYMVQTNGEFFNIVNQTPFIEWNINNLKAHIANRTYSYENKSGSFLARFYNDTSPSECCGIESLVYPDILQKQPDTENSFVDCAYWGGKCHNDDFGSLLNITGITDNPPYYTFRLDLYHVAKYNVTYESYG